MPRLVWKTQDATELVEAIDSESLDDLLQDRPAVYLWRRRFSAPSGCISDAKTCESWISEVSSQPLGRVRRKSIAPCLWTEGLQVGGGGLSPDKQNTLEAACAARSQRQVLVNFLEGLSDFTQPMYIGQTNNLKVRVKQHLCGETGLQSYVFDTLGLSWDDIQFRYINLSKSKKMSAEARALQELLELIAQRSLAPFATERPG